MEHCYHTNSECLCVILQVKASLVRSEDERKHSSVNPLNACVGGLGWWLPQEQNGVSLFRPGRGDGGTSQHIAHAGVTGGRKKELPFLSCGSVQYHMYAHFSTI